MASSLSQLKISQTPTDFWLCGRKAMLSLVRQYAISYREINQFCDNIQTEYTTSRLLLEFSVIPSFHPTPSQEILPLTQINSSLQKASPKTGRFSLNGPKTRQQSYIYEQSLQLIQSCIVHHFSARILTFQNQEYTSVWGTQRHKGFGLLTYFSILFLLDQHQGQQLYSHCGYLAPALIRQARLPHTAATHPRPVCM